jgi:diaminohydroxyphosphoribosylaminopyrimidine deaminase/5-amino-6-(5-phosphoribosylamino)uracil reductase
LRRAGVKVTYGVCREEAGALIAPFAKRMLTGMPYVTLKLGVTLDGRIADESGKSQWITGPQARKKVQQMRRAADAVMVGAGTVRTDNPSLMPRPAKGRAPWRVVVGSDIPKKSKVLIDDAADRTLVVSASLKKILRDLAKSQDVMHVLCEGGGELAGSLIRAGLVDEFVIFMAPSLLGGTGFPMVGEKGWALSEMPSLSFQTLEKCGEDVLLRAVIKEK